MNQEKWLVAVVGTKSSGKSTFLARLYGSQVAQTDSGASYLISFPVASESDAEKKKSLEEIESLWNNISNSEDKEKKFKTVYTNELTFGVSSNGIEREISTADIPGEVFDTEASYDGNEEFNRAFEEQQAKRLKSGDSGDTPVEVIAAAKKKFDENCPRYRGVVIIVPADEWLTRVEHGGLVSRMMSLLKNKNDAGDDVLRLIVVTKVEKAIRDGKISLRKLHKKILKTEDDLASATGAYVRCVACDSLCDLVREGGRWRLPNVGEERNMPSGVMSPSEALVSLFDIPVYLRKKVRNRLIRKISLIAASILAVLFGLWCWIGVSADNSRYMKIEGTQHEVRDGFEEYLKAPFFGKFGFPYKGHTSEAQRRWRSVVFDGRSGTYYKRDDQSNTNLDEKRVELDRIKKDGLFKFTDKQLFESLESECLNRSKEIRADFETRIAQAVSNLYACCEKEDDLTLELVCEEMPSLSNRVLEVAKRERKKFADERDMIDRERELLSDMSDKKKYCDFLLELEGKPRCIFASNQGNRSRAIRSAASNLDGELRSAPFFVAEVSRKMEPVVKKHCDRGRDYSRDYNFGSIREDAEKGVAKLKALDAELSRTYTAADSWSERLKICNEAIIHLKDYPSTAERNDGWKVRKERLSKGIDQSKSVVDTIEQKVEGISDDPTGQIHYIEECILSKENRALSPEDVKRLEDKLSLYRQQASMLSNAWDSVVVAYNNFKTNHSAYQVCLHKIDNFEDVCSRQKRANGVKQYNIGKIKNGIKDEGVTADKLKKEYYEAWGNRRNNKEVAFRSTAEALVKLLSTRYSSSAKDLWIDDWVKEIEESYKSCNAASEDSVFVAAIQLLRIRETFEARLRLDPEAEAKIGDLQETWNKKHLDLTRSEVEKVRGNFPEKAIRLWRNYLAHVGGSCGWEPYADEDDEPKADILRLSEHLNKQKAEEIDALKLNLAAKLTAGQYTQITNNVCKIKQLFAELNVKTSQELLKKIDETMKTAQINRYNWHKARLEKVLGDFPKANDGKGILCKWNDVDRLEEIVCDIYADDVIRGMVPPKGFDKFKERCDKLRGEECKLALRIDGLSFSMQQKEKGTKSYEDTYYMPEFQLYFVVHEKLRKLIFDYGQKDPPKKDPERLELKPALDGTANKKYVVFKSKQGDFRDDATKGISLAKGDSACVTLQHPDGRRKDGLSCVSLELVSQYETPAVLLNSASGKFKSEKRTLARKGRGLADDEKFEYYDFELKVSLLDESCVEMFKFPTDFDGFLSELE